ncbi:hypothetical protein C0Q70_20111 [Pomacea canaliculata]|uniref:15-hydroxyprostaglandin dehydrogenase [NAD(+)] n=1 Tax=Pomacea canaliculata TaxID=400727 RepID=A0A2T7NEN0_POMCA|nr:15-hydroxyprostaglandin dehydrogenase [NAD(+)]-like [Pomacea canaliculata]PVD19621.1 hypothetical protein C0Q70_20111 [Pomacea canaliculata]
MNLSGKRVFLTGGARGIGRGISEALLSKGAMVMFCDINPGTGKQTEEELQKQYSSDSVSFIKADVADSQQLKAAFEAAVTKFGAVDIHINNAGILDQRIWERMFAVNAIGTIRGCQIALEHMRRDKGGHGGVIMNVVSMGGLGSSYWFPAYTASKHAVIGFVNSWAESPYQPQHGVRWGCVCPVSVDTEMLNMEENQIYDLSENQKHTATHKVQISDVVDAFMKLVQDENSNGALMEVSRENNGVYCRRQLVYMNNVSPPCFMDNLPFPGQT